MKNPRYSIIKYCENILEDDIGSLYNYIDNGIIVHLFLKRNLKDKLYLNEYKDNDFNNFIDNGFLYIYEEEYDVINNVIIAIDGYILEKNLYEKISNNKESNFNHHQYDIITSPVNSNIIVISGAGTGKTTTMINRLIYLRKTQDEFSFEQAVLITFTNKSSLEMKERLLITLEKYYKITKNSLYLEMMEEVSRSSIGTIHNFAKKLINSYGKNIGINKRIEIKSFKYKKNNAITQAINKIYEEDKWLYNIVRNYPIYELENKLLSIWENLDNFSIDINSNVYNVDFGKDDKGFSEFIYKALRYAQEIIDKEKETELEVADLMKILSNDVLFKNLPQKYKVVMVDEFQDSDNIQIEFVAKFWNSTGANLLVVGDEKQSIYRFRGAQHTAFNKLKELLKNSSKNLKEFTMIRNYRTSSIIIEDINNIFIDIDKRIEHFNYKKEDYIYSLIDRNKENHIEYLILNETSNRVKFYNALINNKKNDETIAVLFRTNNDVKEFKEFCDRNSILCRVDTTGGFYRHEAVRDFYIMIKALLEENDSALLYSFINTPYINKTVNKNIVINGLEKEKKDHFIDILEKSGWNNIKKNIVDKNPLVLIDKILFEYKPVTKYYVKTLIKAKKRQDNYKEIAYAKTLEYKLNLEHLIYLIKDKFSDNITSIFQIEHFLRIKIATDNTVDTRRPGRTIENKFIQCLTVHKAKGLEYDYVILDKLTNKIIYFKSADIILKNINNHIMIGYKVMLGDDEYKNDHYSNYIAEEKDEIVGEEARLLYVALTRCRKKLFLNMSGELAATNANTWKSLLGGNKSYV